MNESTSPTLHLSFFLHFRGHFLAPANPTTLAFVLWLLGVIIFGPLCLQCSQSGLWVSICAFLIVTPFNPRAFALPVPTDWQAQPSCGSVSHSFKYLLKCHLCREAFSDSLPFHSKNIFSTCFISLLCTYFHPTCYIFCQSIWFIVSPHTRMSAFPTQGIWFESLSYPQHTQQHLVQSRGSINISPKNEWVRIKEDSFNFLHLFFLFLSFLFVAKSEQAPGFLPQAASLYNQDLRSARSCQHCFKRLYLAFPASHFSCMSSPEELWKLGLTSTGR